MNQLLPIVETITLLGSALIGGVFFAFSSFVMKALARVPSPAGTAAMQSINIVVMNRSFLGAFMGTAVLSLGVNAQMVEEMPETPPPAPVVERLASDDRTFYEAFPAELTR